MNPQDTPLLLPEALDGALLALKRCAHGAAKRTADGLALAALEVTDARRRDELLQAQFALNRNLSAFATAYDLALDKRLARELGGEEQALRAALPSGWQGLSLVDDSEVEIAIAADRFALQASMACEWELRELDGYVTALLASDEAHPFAGTRAGTSGPHAQSHHARQAHQAAQAQRLPNPLRPTVLGHALAMAVQAVDERRALQRLLVAEVGRSLAGALPEAYGQISRQLQSQGVTPSALAVRQRASRPATAVSSGNAAESGAALGPGSAKGEPYSHTRALAHGEAADQANPLAHPASGHEEPQRLNRRRSPMAPESDGHTDGRGDASDSAATAVRNVNRGLGVVAAPLMSVLRHAVQNEQLSIQAHRVALREAATAPLDHMVIDVIAALFEQILSDPRIASPLAHQIGRLQIPVLRAAIGDKSFFSSRRHPVRRFINRIASLGVAFDDLQQAHGQRFLQQVSHLVQQVVQGDFEQVATYEAQLTSLEALATQLAHSQAREQGVALEAFADKEAQLRQRTLYQRQLDKALPALPVPEFLRQFLLQVWSRVLLAAQTHGPNEGHARPEANKLNAWRQVPRALVLSVCGKSSSEHRAQFIAQLPKLMQTLTEGLNLIGWPSAQREAFFGQLMPAHAQALRAPAARQLDLNLLAKTVDAAFGIELPQATAAPPPDSAHLAHLANLDERGRPASAMDETERASLTEQEAQQLGLANEATLALHAPLAADTARAAEESATAQLAAAPIGALPAPAGPSTPSKGRPLADAVQLGFAYQLLLHGQWEKFKLTYMSPGRAFFVFNGTSKHHKTVSLTYRMLVGLCEQQRLRSYETAYLLERATARARNQLDDLAKAQPVA